MSGSPMKHLALVAALFVASGIASAQDLLIRNATVHTASAQGTLRATDVLVRNGRIVAIGISTGGVQSIEAVLRHLGPDTPGIVLVQHMPEKFTASFAARLNSQYTLEVLEARDGDAVLDGRVLIAPGGKQMTLRRQGGQYTVEVRDGPPVNHHRPSVDVLFSSVARCAGRHAVGIIMTGMGGDGARGLLEMREAGASTAAQDEASCIVFGMPAEAIKLGAVQDVLPLGRIADWISSTGSRSLVART